jgi:hypothetical protein
LSKIIFKCKGGTVALPSLNLVLVPREAGGNLIVNPPREVWERSELTRDELTQWSYLVAATGRAMLDALPQLKDGCINYWEAGNWALNIDADPAGEQKTGPRHRRVHLHLLGRNPRAEHPDFRWGEAPRFSDYDNRFTWAAKFERLTADECEQIVQRTEELLRSKYGMGEIAARDICSSCKYPMLIEEPNICAECVLQMQLRQK